MAFGVGVADRQRAAKEAAFATVGIAQGAQARSIVDVGQHDIGEHRRRRESDAVRSGPAELVWAEVVCAALIGQRAGLQVGQADFLVRRHRHVVQAQRAFGRQGDDLDRLQRLTVWIDEAAFEKGIAQDDDRFFGTRCGNVGNVRRGVAETLETDLVGIVAAVTDAVAGLVGRVDVARIGDDEAAVGHAGDARLVLNVRGVGVDSRLAIDLLACCVVLLHVDVVGRGGGVGPAHHPATVLKRGHRRLVLLAVDVGVDAELGTDFRSCSVETLAVDTGR